MNELDKTQVVALLIKIKGIDDSFSTLGPLYKFNKSNRLRAPLGCVDTELIRFELILATSKK